MERCALCPGVNHCLPAEGPRQKGGVLFIGEAPGKDEQKKQRIFIGKTGREVDEHYLPLAGLRRATVIFTNAIKCLPTSAGGKLDPKRPKDKALLQSCISTHLLNEIDELEPRLVVPMGAFACMAIDPRIHLDLHHGRPFDTHWGFQAFPMYHPALGMHSPKQMLHIRTDWQRLKLHLAGHLRLPVDDYPEPDYAEVTDAEELDALDPDGDLACDTESSRMYGPYFITYSQAPGTGRLIRARDTHLLERFQLHLSRRTGPVYFHNWLYDARIVSEMELRFPNHLIRDTMVLAYHLGNLPQGLKALAFRELGMQMQDFEDLVIPYSIPKVLDYYRLAQAYDWPKPEPQLDRDKNGDWKMKNPQGMNTKLKRFFTDYSKNPEKDVFNMWEENWTDEQAMIEAELGPWPGMDIAHVPFHEALHYACRDSDALIRLVPIIERMRERCHQWLPQENWRN